MVREGPSAILLREIAEAPRSLVYLTVDWSVPERRSRRVFREAAERLSIEQPSPGIDFFSLREDSEWTEAWLEQLNPPGFLGSPRGYGSLIWLEHGRAVDFLIAAEFKTPDDIAKRCQERWAQH